MVVPPVIDEASSEPVVTVPPEMDEVKSPTISTVPCEIPPVMDALLPKCVEPRPLRLAAVIVPDALEKFRLAAFVFELLNAPTVRPVPEIVAEAEVPTVRLAVEL